MIRSVCAYDAKGALTARREYTDGRLTWKTLYTYGTGDQVTSQRYSPDGKLVCHYRYTITPDGRTAERSYYDSSSKELNSRWVRSYDAQKHLTRQTDYNRKGAETSRTSYRCDSRGNPVEAKTTTAKGSVKDWERCTYTYDSVGNWVKKVTTRAFVSAKKTSWQVNQVTTRKITYYPKG